MFNYFKYYGWASKGYRLKGKMHHKSIKYFEERFGVERAVWGNSFFTPLKLVLCLPTTVTICIIICTIYVCIYLLLLIYFLFFGHVSRCLAQIDKVEYPSWQTQVNGYKKWTLRTPTECFFQCKRQFEVLMEPGSTSE